MIAGLGLGLDYSWSRSRTKGLGRQSVLVSKQVVSTTTLLRGNFISTVFLYFQLSVQKQHVSDVRCKGCENDFSLPKGCGL